MGAPDEMMVNESRIVRPPAFGNVNYTRTVRLRRFAVPAG
jgi:hypothetical protein